MRMKNFITQFLHQNYITPIILVGIYGAAMLLFQMELLSLDNSLNMPIYASLRSLIMSVSYSVSFVMGYIIWLLLGVIFSFTAIIFGANSFNLSKILKISSLSYVLSAFIIIAGVFIFGTKNIEYLVQTTNIAAAILYLGYIGVVKITCSISILRSFLVIATPISLITVITYIFRLF